MLGALRPQSRPSPHRKRPEMRRSSDHHASFPPPPPRRHPRGQQRLSGPAPSGGTGSCLFLHCHHHRHPDTRPDHLLSPGHARVWCRRLDIYEKEEEETNWKSGADSPASPDHISRCPSASRLPLATWRRGPPWPPYKRRSSPPLPGRHRHGCSLRPDGGPCRYPFREFSKSVPRHGSHRPWLPRCDSFQDPQGCRTRVTTDCRRSSTIHPSSKRTSAMSMANG